jgi:ribonuclease D
VIDFVDDAESLAGLARELAGESALAVDLEADSLHHYREKVCLVQISTPRRDILLDTLAVRDLAPLREIFADPAVRKIFHAADYDLRSLWRDFGIEVRGLHDTSIAAQLLGEEKIGLADLLAKHFGVTLDKRYQRADWSRRPLSPEMVSYAAEDTRHLGRLSALLERELAAKGRMAWAEEEWSLLEQVRFAQSDKSSFQRVKGSQLLNRRGLAILDELVRWRETEAERRDVPPFKVMGNETLLEVVRLSPEHRRDLHKAGPGHRRVMARYEEELVGAVARGLALDEDRLPAWPSRERAERDPQAETRLKHLKTWRAAAAERLGISPGILINNALLEELSRTPPRTIKALEHFPAMKHWQRRELGAEIIAALHPKKSPSQPGCRDR